MSSSISAEEFKAAQRAGWNSVAPGWRKWWAMFEDGAQTLSDKLVELAELKPHHRVLDIATGIGEPALTAARKVRPNGQVIGTDISSEMVAIARERAKEVGLDAVAVFEDIDAENYLYPSSSFNAVISRWGLMFLPNLTSTLQKIRASLVPDGILSAAVWSVPDKAPVLMLAFRTAAQKIGLPPPGAGSPGPFKLADTVTLENSFIEAGFRNIKIETVNLRFRFNSANDFVNFHRAINAPIHGMLKNQPIERQEEVWKGIADAAKAYCDNTGIMSLDNEVICVSGQR
ncbi:MAG: class I SAM-dependent methyltransferase [Thermoproteota archaeon]|nr:class I SAM-dependent methyltransferase [Thermoproteota archaeon]